ncbi:MAG: hypothetical protein ACI8YI_002539 [Paracoccaceae bacterium]|jgi:hypothetical protein
MPGFYADAQMAGFDTPRRKSKSWTFSRDKINGPPSVFSREKRLSRNALV